MEYAKIPKSVRVLVAATRTLFANARRTLAVLASLAVGVVALCLIGGYYQYTTWGLAQSLIRSQYGHIELYAKGYRTSRDLDPFAKPIDGADELLRVLRSDPDIEVAAPRELAFGTAYCAKSGRTAVVEIRGVEPDEEASIFTFVTTKRGGSLSPRDTGSCQLAPTLASELGAGLSDDLVLSAVRVDDQQNALSLRVKALVGSYSEEFDRLAVQVPRSTFTELFGFSGAQEIAVLLKDGVLPERKLADLRRELLARGFDLDANLWYEQAAYFRQVLSYYQGFYRVVLGMVAILAFFVVATTLRISLRERLREFGTRRAMGEGHSSVAWGILAEALVSGMVGLACGLVLALIGALAINLAGGIPMPPAPGLTTALRVRIILSPQGIWLSLALCIAVPPIAASLPAASVSRMSVVALLDRGKRS